MPASFVAMAGGTLEHAQLAVSLGHLVTLALQGRPCAILSSNAKLRIEAIDVATYPDLAVVCHARERSPVDPMTLINPTVLVEVTSPTSEGYDCGEKFEHYRRIPSLPLM